MVSIVKGRYMSALRKPDGLRSPYSEIRDLQIRRNQRAFHERIDRIKLLKHRANETGIAEIRAPEDVMPLLLPHRPYKSYPESFLAEKHWDRLPTWLGTVSAHPTDNVDLCGVDDVDGWVAACSAAGHFASCSSGTTGKPAMLPASRSRY